MRKDYFTLFCVWSMALLYSCQSDNENYVNPLENNGQVTFISTINTRVSGTTWGNDAIGVFAIQNGQPLSNSAVYDNKSNIKYTTPGSGTFTVGLPAEAITFPSNGNQLDFVAYYPFTSAVSNYLYAINLADQSNLSPIDLLYSNNATGKSQATPTVALTFNHKLSLLILNIAKGDGVASLNGLTVKIEDMITEGTFSLIDGTTITPGSAKAALSPVVTVSSDNATATVNAILLPGEDLNNAKLTFTLDGKVYEWIPGTQTLVSGMKYTYPIQLSITGVVTLNPQGTIEDWIEGNTGGNDVVLTPSDNPVFTADKSTVQFGASTNLSTVVTITTQSDQGWSIVSSDDNWLSTTPASGTGSGSFTITALANTLSARQGTITINATGGGSFSPIIITVDQASGSITPTGNLLFPGSDFEDWSAFMNLLNSFGLITYASQSPNGGKEGSKALYLNGTSGGNEYVFTSTTPTQQAVNPTQITFYLKGTSTAKSLSFNVYVGSGTTMGTDYKCYNLGDCTTDKILPPTNSNAYAGTINTGGAWVKITLNITGLVLNSAPGLNYFALKTGSGSNYNLHIDDITIE